MAEQPTSYSAFNGTQKLLLAYAASISATFSGLASFIYYPAISALARDLHTSTAKINFTITSYLVVAGLAPSILGDMADRIGRRPISLLAMLLFLGANIGLAIQHSYSALVALRCLQSAGASSTIALAYGIISDISTPAERGSYMGILMGFTNAAPSLGPVLGGVLAEKLTWHWVFWLLTVLSGVHLFALSVFLPETSRKLVGDGSWAPQQWMNKSFASVMFSRKPRRPVSEQKAQISVPNPFHCLVALVNRHNFMIILVGGIQYTIFGCLAASLSVQMIDIYSLNYLTAGLVYLPSGVGGIVAAYLTGRLLDYEYRLTARKHGLPVKKADSDVSHFPIEEARLRSVLIFIAINAFATASYGWTLESRTHLVAPLVMQCLTGGFSVAIFVVCGGLLTDLNPTRAATVQASYNLVRCTLGGVGVAVLQPIVRQLGIGWCFTIFAVAGTLCLPILLVIRSRGPRWRRFNLPVAAMEVSEDKVV